MRLKLKQTCKSNDITMYRGRNLKKREGEQKTDTLTVRKYTFYDYLTNFKRESVIIQLTENYLRYRSMH